MLINHWYPQIILSNLRIVRGTIAFDHRPNPLWLISTIGVPLPRVTRQQKGLATGGMQPSSLGPAIAVASSPVDRFSAMKPQSAKARLANFFEPSLGSTATAESGAP